MSDTAKRDAVLDRYSGDGWYVPDHKAMADRIVELEAAVERVRALHAGRVVSSGLHCVCWECGMPFPCPTIRALEETP